MLVLEGLPLWVIVLLVSFITAVITEVAVNMTAILLMMPVLIALVSSVTYFLLSASFLESKSGNSKAILAIYKDSTFI